MNQVVVPFSLTATQVNALGATPITLISFANDRRVRIPTRLELIKESGTAYTITVTGETFLPVAQSGQRVPDSYAGFFAGGAFLVLEAVDENGSGRPYAFVPETGFLSVASEQTRLIVPEIDGQAFRTGAVSFAIRSSAVLSSGTGGLRGRLYFDEYPLGNF